MEFPLVYQCRIIDIIKKGSTYVLNILCTIYSSPILFWLYDEYKSYCSNNFFSMFDMEEIVVVQVIK